MDFSKCGRRLKIYVNYPFLGRNTVSTLGGHLSPVLDTTT